MKSERPLKNLLFLLPSLIGVIIFYIIPFLDVIRRAFFNDIESQFVGLNNFQKVFQNKAFLLACKNTLSFVMVSIPVLLCLSLLFAVMLKDYRKKGGIFLKVTYLLPLAIPVAALTGVWQITFHENGMFNVIRNMLGLDKIDWLNSDYAMVVLIITYVWRNFGYAMILWLAGLASVDTALYEAAALEGANKRKIFFKITMPLLKPLSFTISVLAILNTFKVFRDIYLLSGDYPDKSIYMVQHILNNWFTDMEFGKITAAAIIILIVVIVLVMGLLKGFSWQKRESAT